MTNFNYKKYSLEQLENWVSDALSCGEASADEIYEVIHGVVEEIYYENKHRTGICYDLLCKLNGHKVLDNDPRTVDQLVNEGYTMTSDGFWIPPDADKVSKWVLPVEIDGPSGEMYISLPDDLLESVGWQDGDQLEWIDLNDGTFKVRKTNGAE